MRPLAQKEKDELRRMTDALVSHGYGEREAANLIWKGYCGGMEGAKAVFRQLEAIPEIGNEILF